MRPAAVARLAALPPIEYDRVRDAEAKRLGIRVATLDCEVTKARESLNPREGASIQGQAVVFDDPEPWPDKVDGAAAINEVSETLSGRLALPDGAADAMALWTTHAHCHTAFLHSPRLNITSPEKGCGKTLALDVLQTLTPKAIRTARRALPRPCCSGSWTGSRLPCYLMSMTHSSATTRSFAARLMPGTSAAGCTCAARVTRTRCEDSGPLRPWRWQGSKICPERWRTARS